MTWFRAVGTKSLSLKRPRAVSRRWLARSSPAIEVLEARNLPSTFIVTTTADSGAGSLRAAIQSANSDLGPDTIDFNIGSGVQRIHLQSPLPTITTPVSLDGTTQPGFAGTPIIVLDGSTAGPSADGLTVMGGNSTVRGLVIHSFGGSGIVLTGGGDDVVAGNYIGTDFTGKLPIGNGQRGIYINGASDNTIGGTALGAGNVISANAQTGLLIADSSNNVVKGNKIGTDATGMQALGNLGFGIRLWNATDNNIGGITARGRNIISANELDGLFVGVGSTGNLIHGNYIGTDIMGSDPLGNLQRGVEISSASFNTIGGTVSGAGNVISANQLSGIVLTAGAWGCTIQQNFIGTDATGMQPLGNGGLGIRLQAADDTLIGGTAPGAGNVISGNGLSGIRIGHGSAGTVVQGNYIGTDVTGLHGLGNSHRGITISAASNNVIGGTMPGAGNVISGNNWAGIVIEKDSQANQVQGNLIGTDKTGTQALGNGAAGVRISDSTDNLVGGTTASAANVISGNDQDGVHLDTGASGNLVQGNFIGTDSTATIRLGNGWNGVAISNSPDNSIGGSADGAANTIENNLQVGVLIEGAHATGNTIVANSIDSNNEGGIQLVNGGNSMTESPSLGGAFLAGQNAMVEGAVVGDAFSTYTLDFYANSGTDASGHVEGKTFIGSSQVVTDTNGIGLFNVTLNLGGLSGQSITATATDSTNNTSAFSVAAPSTQV
jgi:titin